MRLIAHLVAKDLRRKARSPLGLIAALAFPLVFAGLIALAFGRGSTIPRVRMLIDNEDDGLIGNGLASVFTAQQSAKYFEGKAVTAAEGRVLMEAGKASALLTIPKGFTKDVLDGKPVTLRLLKNPSEGILPEIADQTTGTLADALDGARRAFAGPIAEIRPLFEDQGGTPTDAEVTAVAMAVKRGLEGLSNLVFPPAITLESELFGNAPPAPVPEKKATSPDAPGTIFLLVLPGVAVYALFLVADQGMRDVMTERALGTLRRQLAGPVRAETVIVAKALYTAVLAAIAIVLMALVGALVVSVPIDAAAFLLVSVTLVLAVTGTTAVVYGLARTERQASTLGNMLFLLMGFVGGGFIRVEGLPPFLRAIAPWTPLYWGTRGYRAIVERSAGVSDVLLPAGVLAALGAALLVLGAWALRRSARSGAGATA